MCNNHRLHHASTAGQPSILEGIEAIDYLLREVYKIEVSKALNPLDDGDFLVISARLSEALRKAVAGEEGKALTAALNALDVKWTDLTEAGRGRVMSEVKGLLTGAVERTLPKIDKVLSTSGTRIATDTKVFADRKFKLQIGTSLNQADKASIDFLRRNTAMFVTDSSGRKIVSATNHAADIVARGLDSGMGSADITERLISEIGPRVGRAESYWDVVSMAYSNDARNTTTLRSFSEAGIESYQFVAVLDERTTPTCFSEGTLVHTPSGRQAIETLQPGDLVITGKGLVRPIRATSKRRVNDWTIITVSNGETIQSTENHPFLTDRGWTRASSLEAGSSLRVSPLRKRDTRPDPSAPLLRHEVSRRREADDLQLRSLWDRDANKNGQGTQAGVPLLFDGLSTQRPSQGRHGRSIEASVCCLYEAISCECRGGFGKQAANALLQSLPEATTQGRMPNLSERVRGTELQAGHILLTGLLPTQPYSDEARVLGAEHFEKCGGGFYTRTQGGSVRGGFCLAQAPDSDRSGRGLLAFRQKGEGSSAEGESHQGRRLDVGPLHGRGVDEGEESNDHDLSSYLRQNGEVAQIRAVESYQEDAYCYNIQVEDDPTYLVGEGIVVHNCAFLDGRVFSVGTAVDMTSAVASLEDPKDIREAKPWIKEGRNDNGDRLLYVDKGGERKTVTEFDSKGGFKNSMSNKDIEASGLQVPPLHGLCRSTLIPV